MSIIFAHGQKENSIAHTMLLADYDYVCNTRSAIGEAVEDKYSLTLQISPVLSCTMGYKKHKGENDHDEQLHYIPTTWQNYPHGKMTSLEVIPPYRYLTSEKMNGINWKILADKDSICGYSCQKAEGEYGGRKWIVWFSESLPTTFGPWRFYGLPGLILRAESEDKVHHFECKKVDAVKEQVSYRIPTDAIKCTREKFVRLRNKTFCNPNYLTQPTYYIKPSELSGVFVMDGAVMFGDVPINLKPTEYQPLDY